MTVTYTSEVTTSGGFGCFLKLLLRWRGSIYKLIWPDLFVFMILYYCINVTYRLALDAEQKLIFERIVRYCEKYANLIPLSFVLGFYVTQVMTRWWSQYNAIPFPDNLAILISAVVKDEGDHARVVRRTIMRYVCLSFAITLTMISPKIKKRFPTLGHFVEAGLLERDEKKIIEDIDNEYPSYPKYWLPLTWASNIITRARHEGLIRDDPSLINILGEVNKFRTECSTLLDYDWISIPLVYTQVVTLAVYSYFVTTLLGRQWIETHNKDDIDLYFPALTILEFFFYMGWLRVAETLINPFGDDDDDFEVVWMIDRHVQVSYLIVDTIHHNHPKLMKDQYWSKKTPNQLPHTLASKQFKKEYPVLSTNGITIGGTDAEILSPDTAIVDGKTRSSSFLSRLFPRRRMLPINAELNRIRSESLNETGEIDNTSEPTQESNKDDSDFTEFDNLKKLRRAIFKQKVIKYYQALKEAEDKQTLDSLLSSSVESNL